MTSVPVNTNSPGPNSGTAIGAAGAEGGSPWVARILAAGMVVSLLLAYVLDKLNADPAHRMPVIAMGVIALALGTLLVLSDSRSGIAVFILISCVSPRLGANFRLEDMLLPAIILAWIGRITRGDRFILRTPVTLPLLFVAVTMLLSFFWGLAQGTIPSPVSGVFVAVKRMEYGVLFLYALNSVQTREAGRALLITFLTGAVLASLVSLAGASSNTGVGDTRATGLDEENYNTFAGFLVIAFSLAIAGTLASNSRMRWVLGAVSLLLVVTLLKTYSREGYYMLAVSLLVLGILRYRILIPAIFFLTLSAQFILPSSVVERAYNSVNEVQNYQNESSGENSFSARVGGWTNRWAMVGNQPILGNGPGSVPMHIDNEYLLRLIESGVIGLAAFLYLLFACGRYLIICAKRLRGTESEAFAYGLLAAFVAMLVQGTVAAAWSTIRTMEPFWILAGAVGGLVVHHTYITNESSKEAEPAGVGVKA